MTRLSSQLFALVCLVSAAAAFAQKPTDTRLRIASPDGQIVFILSDAPHTHSADPASNDLRYSIDFHTKWLMDESVLGLKIDGQPPLGPGMKQIGLHASQHRGTQVRPERTGAIGEPYDSALVDLADDSGRKLSLEVRAYNDGIAFRYILPKAPALQSLRVERELTQFIYNKNATVYPFIVGEPQAPPTEQRQPRAIGNVPPQWLIGMPLLGQIIGVGWVSIAEAKAADYPALLLRKEKAALGFDAELASGATQAAPTATNQSSLATSWRALAIGDDRRSVAESGLVTRLAADPSER